SSVVATELDASPTRRSSGLRDRVGALLRDALLLGGSRPGSGGSALGGSDLRGSAAAHGCLDLLLPRDLLFLGGLDLAEGLLAALERTVGLVQRATDVLLQRLDATQRPGEVFHVDAVLACLVGGAVKAGLLLVEQLRGRVDRAANLLDRLVDVAEVVPRRLDATQLGQLRAVLVQRGRGLRDLGLLTLQGFDVAAARVEVR